MPVKKDKDFFSKIGKISHQKSPRPKEFYSENGKKGMASRWGDRNKKMGIKNTKMQGEEIMLK